MGIVHIVWICTTETCDDQPFWISSKAKVCPACKSIENVTRIIKFGNLEE